MLLLVPITVRNRSKATEGVHVHRVKQRERTCSNHVCTTGLLSCMVRYGTILVCTIRTVLVVIRRTTVIVTPYFTVITVQYGTVYGTVPCWHCQCKNGLRKASPPQNLPFSLPSVLLPCDDATQCFPERPWGWVKAASAWGKGPAVACMEHKNWTQYLIFGC